MTGALTGIRAVISPKQLITDEMTRTEPASASSSKLEFRMSYSPVPMSM